MKESIKIIRRLALAPNYPRHSATGVDHMNCRSFGERQFGLNQCLFESITTAQPEEAALPEWDEKIARHPVDALNKLIREFL